MSNAKIIFLLMVMIASALCSTEDVVIMLKSANHNKALHITSGGKVTAADISIAQIISIGSSGDFVNTKVLKLTLYSKQAERYLCFNKHWKLVGMKNLKESCYFIESIDRGYFEYHSALNQTRRVGFNRRFRPVVLQNEQNLNPADVYFHFQKIPASQFDFNAFTEAERKAALTSITQTHQKRRNNNNNNNRRLKKTNSNNGHNSTLRNNVTSINSSSNLSQKNKHNNSKSSGSSLQPKLLVRHKHNNSSIVERRLRHEREQKIRQLRKQVQPESTTSSATNLSAKSSTTILAPVLNIFATLAASRRTRGRRKSDDISSTDDDENENDNDKVVKQKQVIETPSITDPIPSYLMSKNPEHRHRHQHQHPHSHPHPHPHHQIPNEYQQNIENTNSDANLFSIISNKFGDQIANPTATSGLKQQQFSNEYSNKNINTNSNINYNNNYLAIPALPKNLYNNNNNKNNNRMTEYVYSGSTNINNNLNLNLNSKNIINNNDRTSSSSKTSYIDSHSKEMNINNNLNIDNNFKDYLNTTKDKNYANRKNLFEAIKNINNHNHNNNNNNKTKNIVQYRYAVSFISIKHSLSI